MYLFIDSCEYLTLGLLNEKFEWVDYEQVSSQKNSEIFHTKLYELLTRANLTLDTIEKCFLVAGPGSYTGMRLSEGMGQLLQWHKKKIYSFYHFEVPALLNFAQGVWLSEAFKGELFFYKWNSIVKSESMELVPKQDKENEIWVDELYGDYDHVFTHFATGNFDCEYTTELIRRRPSELFPKIVALDLQRESYYYRPLEKEFKQSFPMS